MRVFDQRLRGGEWVWHGRYPFLAGTASSVETSDAGGQVSVDAIRLTAAPVEAGDRTPPDTTIVAGPTGTIAATAATFAFPSASIRAANCIRHRVRYCIGGVPAKCEKRSASTDRD